MQKPNTAATVNKVDEYLQVLPADTRKTLEQLRQIIRAAAPGAEEVVSYGVEAKK